MGKALSMARLACGVETLPLYVAAYEMM